MEKKSVYRTNLGVSVVYGGQACSFLLLPVAELHGSSANLVEPDSTALGDLVESIPQPVRAVLAAKAGLT